MFRKAITAAIAAVLGLASATVAAAPIDRPALVARHDPVFTAIDRHAPVMLGNGALGFTADITGLQTFPEQYAPTSPLLTMAQWAWHSFPNPRGYTAADGEVLVPVPGRGRQPYAYMRDFAEAAQRPALAWLRENPHRISLGRVALALTLPDGTPATFAAISDTRQRLDLWTGTLHSDFRFAGAPVSVVTRVDAGRDAVLVEIRSPLVATGQVGIDVRYPGVAAGLNPDPSDWNHPDAHRTIVTGRVPGGLTVRRQIDGTTYYSALAAAGAVIRPAGPHGFRILARSGDRLVASISFEQTALPARFDEAARAAATTEHWRDYWTKGGMIDLSGSTDRRAPELERRIVLSQYLAAINQAGAVPPQEEGLFSNSWNGKFHLEMHPWHAAHFAIWGRPELLERSLGWYRAALPGAMADARRHRVDGAWWPKMSGPEGRSSPSPINPFIMWQQPHPIYLAELAWRAQPDKATLARHAEIVEQTARLLASWPRLDPATGRYSLGPPIIPVQENHDPMTTVDPAFELAYFRWGLETAQAWRVRRGLARDAGWDRVIAGLAPLPVRDGLYLPVATAPDFWRVSASAACRRNAVLPQCLNRDHPSFLMAHGLIAGAGVDAAAMRATLAATDADWDLRQTWGWDFPMIAMTAARLGDPEAAIDWLLRAEVNNQWGPTGMTPRVALDPAARGGPDGPGFVRVADTYFPSNGALLLAVGMMAAGWDGAEGPAPGFPRAGWQVRSENIRPLP
ncbi:hypothetical protein [Polymorphobacter fuscus]|uniref:hypothetical protein n=1 Tax=Sandarakinorhabdus fusca TaxID=1439888 RepID=UPI001698C792|nr:hypothetical protein [Polymorphobacter fuscus]NJC08401.1 hypothetical protein [Polymorphobacter fuscus]